MIEAMPHHLQKLQVEQQRQQALQQAKADGVPEQQLAKILELQRKAQWRVDCINAENSMGFHAPQEAARVLGEAIDFSRQGQLALRDIRDKQAK